MPGRRSRAVLSGTIAGLRLATKAYEPSLMPRSAIDQGLVNGGSFLSGFVSGAAVSLVFDFLPRRATGPLLRAAGVVATGSRTARAFAKKPSDVAGPDPERAAWMEFTAEVLSAVAMSRLITHPRSNLARTGAIAAISLTSAADTSAAIGLRTDNPDATYIATSAGVGLGANAALAALVGIVRVGGWIPSRLARSSRSARFFLRVAGSAVTAAAIGHAGKYAVSQMTGKIAAGNAATEIAYADVPRSQSVSGSKPSAASYDTLGVQGRRLVSEVVTADDIDDVMGESARSEAIRVYIGINSATTEDALVDLAIAELDRTGAFDRSRIVAASPAGTGYVNYIAIEAAELMARGDCATVAIQYGSLPSMMSTNKVAKATRLYGSLLRRIRHEIDSRASKATLIAYGESLGATTGQAGIKQVKARSGPVVDRALWVGTPRGSSLFERLTAAGAPVFDNPTDLQAYIADNDVPNVIFLSHDNDPVTKFALEDLYSMPDWLREPDRGRGTNEYQRWLPAVAFFQGLVDTKNAATVVPGEFFSTGHDYRADLASFVRAAFGFDDVTDDQMERIEARLRESEVKRSAGIELGKFQSA